MPPVRILYFAPAGRTRGLRGATFSDSIRRPVGLRGSGPTSDGLARRAGASVCTFSRPASLRPGRVPCVTRDRISRASPFSVGLLPRLTRCRGSRRKWPSRASAGSGNPVPRQRIPTSLVIGDADGGLKTAARSGTTRANRRTRYARTRDLKNPQGGPIRRARTNGRGQNVRAVLRPRDSRESPFGNALDPQLPVDRALCASP